MEPKGKPDHHINASDPQVIVDAYIRYLNRGQDDDSWAFREVWSATHTDPDKGWQLLVMLLASAGSREHLGQLGAGPLEDLLKNHATKAIAMIEDELPVNRRLQYALANVWLRPDDYAYSKFKEIIEEYDLLETDPLSYPYDDLPLQF